MNDKYDKLPKRARIFWVYTSDLATSLDRATWLETSRYLRKMKWQVTLVTAAGYGRRWIRGVEVLSFPMPKVYFIGQLLFHWTVINHLRKQWQAIDIVLFHEMSAIWLLPLRIFTPKREKHFSGPLLVMDTRTLFMQPESNNTIKDSIRFIYYKLITRLGNRVAHGRLAITPEMANACHVPQSKLWGVWPSGVEPHPFIAAQNKRRWPTAEEPIFLVYIGSLHYERNLLTLSHAVVKVNETKKRFKLLLVGEGTQRTDLEALAAKSDRTIEVFAPIPHEQIPEFLTLAHVGVLPFPDELKFRVSSPIKLFEYMASGMPILATRILCHTSVVADGEYAFWARHSDKASLVESLEEIWLNRSRLMAMGKMATNAVHVWTWSESAHKLGQSLVKGIEQVRN